MLPLRGWALPCLAASALAANALALAGPSAGGPGGLQLHREAVTLDGGGADAFTSKAHHEFDAVLREHAVARRSSELGERRGQLAASNGMSKISLLVSLYLPEDDWWHPHVKEMLAAFSVNLQNPLITSIHVLLEAPGRTCSALPQVMRSALEWDVSPEDMEDRVRCATVARQPTYADFFEYANTTMSTSGTVLLANADVVFDGSLHKLTRPEPGTEGHLISVRAPPYTGQFRRIFQKRCLEVLNKCTPVTKSWDAYAFSLPLSGALKEHDLRFTMNVITADHRAAYALHESGMRLTNPCMHINAFHFHCFSGKMHAAGTFIGERNLTGRGGIYMKAYPCDDFPNDDCVAQQLTSSPT